MISALFTTNKIYWYKNETTGILQKFWRILKLLWSIGILFVFKMQMMILNEYSELLMRMIYQ